VMGNPEIFCRPTHRRNPPIVRRNATRRLNLLCEIWCPLGPFFVVGLCKVSDGLQGLGARPSLPAVTSSQRTQSTRPTKAMQVRAERPSYSNWKPSVSMKLPNFSTALCLVELECVGEDCAAVAVETSAGGPAGGASLKIPKLGREVCRSAAAAPLEHDAPFPLISSATFGLFDARSSPPSSAHRSSARWSSPLALSPRPRFCGSEGVGFAARCKTSLRSSGSASAPARTSGSRGHATGDGCGSRRGPGAYEQHDIAEESSSSLHRTRL
jgi:hypothetical protein